MNVVLKERLCPRSLVGDPETKADERLRAYAEEATYPERHEIESRIRRPQESTKRQP